MTLRVLHVNAGNLYGGVEATLVTLARERACCPEMEPHFALCFSGRSADELQSTGATLTMLGSVRARYPWQVLRARRRLGAILRRKHFDVVICHMPWSLGLFGSVVTRHGIALAFWMHGLAKGGHWTERLARRAAPALVIANSKFTAAAVSELFPSPPPLQVIHCPVAAPRFVRNRADVRHELGAGPDDCVIIQVGRIEPWKGHKVLLGALALLPSARAWKCWIAGGIQRSSEQELFSELQTLTQQLGLENRVHFLGERRDISDLLAATDVFCQPNTTPEPFGMSFVEALWAGLPVVTSALGGALEILDVQCGRLVPPSDPVSLAAALEEVMSNTGFREQVRITGPARATELCDPAAILKQLFDTLVDLTHLRLASRTEPLGVNC